MPNAGQKLVTLPKRLEWNKLFKKHIKELDQKKPVIICGDMNVAHQEIGIVSILKQNESLYYCVMLLILVI